MKKLALLLLLATSLSAQTAPPREAFPSDYKPQPCAADASAVCQSFPKDRMSGYATAFRGYNLHQEWTDAHWEEMRQIFQPFCAKIGNCFTVKGNDWVYCVDIMRDDFLATCDRFPAGSSDREQCKMFVMTYFIGLGAKTQLHAQSQSCIAQQPAPASERTMEAWLKQGQVPVDFQGELIFYAIDSETRIPVRARIDIDGLGELKSTEGPVPTTGYPVKWKAGLKRVPLANGHRGVAAPTVTMTAEGYQPLTFTMPVDVPTMTATMTPKTLKRGMNKFTINAVDDKTGKPVWARVYAGDIVLGETNKPLEFEWPRGEKRPEIWITSLYDRYADAVLLKGE